MAEIDLSLSYTCPVCGAAPQEKCELNTGAPRFSSHLERKWAAKDQTAEDHNRAPKKAASKKTIDKS
jgi:hypothetical protein